MRTLQVGLTLAAATILAHTPAFAQTKTTTTPQTATTSTAVKSENVADQNLKFITRDRADLWRATKLNGLDVYNDNNQKIGDINDLMVDRQGKVEAVVIGVGGFLGMGEHNVAVPFGALQWQLNGKTLANNAISSHASPANTAMNNSSTRPNVTTTAGSAPDPAAGMSTSTNTDTAATSNGSAVNSDSNQDYPDRAILPNATKDQLSKAPEFRWAR